MMSVVVVVVVLTKTERCAGASGPSGRQGKREPEATGGGLNSAVERVVCDLLELSPVCLCVQRTTAGHSRVTKIGVNFMNYTMRG